MFATRVRRAAAATSLLVAQVGMSACSDSKSTAPDVPAVMSVVRGSGESVIVGSSLTDSLVVMVTTAGAEPARGVTVKWAIAQGDGSLSAQTSTTDANGNANVLYTPGHIAGTVNVVASVSSVDDETFAIVQTPDAPTAVVAVADEPTVTVLGSGAVQLSVRILDEFGNSVPGVAVRWTATGGGAHDSFDLALSATDNNGIALVQYTPADVSGARVVTASVADGPSVDIGLNVMPATIVAGQR